jgi:hypothetical protein
MKVKDLLAVCVSNENVTLRVNYTLGDNEIDNEFKGSASTLMYKFSESMLGELNVEIIKRMHDSLLIVAVD